jgi:hypothetical protein
MSDGAVAQERRPGPDAVIPLDPAPSPLEPNTSYEPSQLQPTLERMSQQLLDEQEAEPISQPDSS